MPRPLVGNEVWNVAQPLLSAERPKPGARGPLPTPALSCSVSSSCSRLAVPGTAFPPSMVPPALPPAGDASRSGPARESGRPSGSSHSPSSTSRARSTSLAPLPTAPLSVRFLGASHGTEANRPRQEQLQAPPDYRYQRYPAGALSERRERAGRVPRAHAAAQHTADSRPGGTADLRARLLPRGPRLWLGMEHHSSEGDGSEAAAGPVGGQHARQRTRQAAVCGGKNVPMVQGLAQAARVLREDAAEPDRVSYARRRHDLLQQSTTELEWF